LLLKIILAWLIINLLSLNVNIENSSCLLFTVNGRKQTTLSQKSKPSPNSQIPDIEYDRPNLDNDDVEADSNDCNPSSRELDPESEVRIKEEEQPVKKRPGQNARVCFI